MLNSATILLAEDDANDQLLFNLALVKTGWKVDIQLVEDGQAVVDYLEGSYPFYDRAKHPFPTLLLLDLKMPRRDGFAVLDWLFWRPMLRPRFVTVLSASDRPQDVQRARRLGADSYLIKPHDPSQLVAVVKTLSEYWTERKNFSEVAGVSNSGWESVRTFQ